MDDIDEDAVIARLVELKVLTPGPDGYKIDQELAQIYAPGLWEAHLESIKTSLEQLWADGLIEIDGIDADGDIIYRW